MAWTRRLVVQESLFTAAAFTSACYAYYVVAVWGLQDYLVEGPLRSYLTSPAVHLELLVIGLLFGALIAVINRWTDTSRMRRWPVLPLVAWRTVLHLVALVFSTAVLVPLVLTFVMPWESLAQLFRAMTPRATVSFALFVAGSVLAINLALEVARMIGPGHLWRLMSGRYLRPRDEERVFLFMDLEGSTAIAETLGHRRYSALMQECFRDLTEVVVRYGASVYQYVGDEVVLSWPADDGKPSGHRSVQAFFAYRDALRRKGEEYVTRFGSVPDFRGGIDAGAVTVSEVGDVKREIVYHGDVLNTAARLLELGKARGERLVASRPVGEEAVAQGAAAARWQEEVTLRGKREPVEAFGLDAS